MTLCADALTHSASVAHGSMEWKPRTRKRSTLIAKSKAPRLSQWKKQISAGHRHRAQHERLQLQALSSDRVVTFDESGHLFVPGNQHNAQNQGVAPNGSPIRPELYLNSTPSNPLGSPVHSPMISPNQNGNAYSSMNQNASPNVGIEYHIGDKVMVDESKMGQIKSIGQHPAWGKGTFYGVRLTEKIGSSDGEFKGIFACISLYRK